MGKLLSGVTCAAHTVVIFIELTVIMFPNVVCRSWVFKTWREYFHFSYLNESTLDPEKTYIFVEFPHGVFPMSELIAGKLNVCQLLKVTAGSAGAPCML
jgi:hypothetical protein